MLIFLLVAYFSLDLSVPINVCSVSMPMTKAMTMTLTGREEEDQSSYYIKLKLANCRLLYYDFRAFLQGYVMAFFDQNTEDAKDPRILTRVFIHKKENGNGKN